MYILIIISKYLLLQFKIDWLGLFQLTFRFFPKVYRAETIIELSSSFFPWPGHTALTFNQLCTHSHTHTHTRRHTACLGWVDGCVMQLALNAFSPIKYATQGLCLHFAYTLPCNMHPDRPYPTHTCLTMLCYQPLLTLSCVATVRGVVSLISFT